VKLGLGFGKCESGEAPGVRVLMWERG